MTWDRAGASGHHDTGAYSPPGKAETAGAELRWIGWAALVFIVVVTAVTVWTVHVQDGAAQVPFVVSVRPQAAAAGTSADAGTVRAAGGAPGGKSAASPSPLDRVDHAWAARAAAATGIPGRAFLAYGSADLTIEASQPACGLGWNTLAAIGTVESANGTYGGATLLPDGYTSKPIIGVPLDGSTVGGQRVAAIPDTDHGRLDGDTRWDHAVGPLQFLPATWAIWGADGNGDGIASPDQIDDAALAAARYLCASGTMTTAAGWRAAVYSYNESTAYVNEIADIANRYAADVSGLS